MRRHQQAAVGALPAVPGEHVEQIGDVGAHLGVGGEHAEVLVQPGGLGVVVAGADVAVAPDLVALLAYDQSGLAVGLETDQAVDDVAAGPLQGARPGDVGHLVEARLHLDQHHHLLAGGGRVDQRVDDRRVARGAVQRLLDGQHVGVGRGLLDEALHAGGERVVGVVHQDVALPQPVEHAARHLAVGQLRMGGRDERAVLEVVAVALAEHLPERRQVEQAGHPQHVVTVHVELADQPVEHVVADRRGHLEPDRWPEPPLRQLALERLQQVLVAVLVDLQLGVAGHPEQVPLLDLHAGEQLVQMDRDELLDAAGSGRARLSFCTVTNRGTLLGTLIRANSSEPLSSGSRSSHREVERPAGDVRERVRRIDRERGQHREDLLPEVGAQPLALGRAQLAPADHLDALGGQLGPDLLGEAGRMPGDQVGRPLGDQLELVAQRDPVAAAHRQAGAEPALQSGDPDHVELVEVAREDGQELGPLQQRGVRVLGERQHPGVEVEPGQLPVEEAVLGQLGRGIRLENLLGPGRGRFVGLGHARHDLLRRYVLDRRRAGGRSALTAIASVSVCPLRFSPLRGMNRPFGPRRRVSGIRGGVCITPSLPVQRET